MKYSIHDTWLSDFGLFVQELKLNFGTYNPVGEAESELEALCMQENHQATNILSSSPSLQHASIGVKLHSFSKRIMVSQRGSRTIWSITTNQPPSLVSGSSFKPSTPVIGNKRLRYLEKPQPRDPLATRTRTSPWTTPSLTRARVLHSPSRRAQISPLAPRRAGKLLGAKEDQPRPLFKARERRQANQAGKAVSSR